MEENGRSTKQSSQSSETATNWGSGRQTTATEASSSEVETTNAAMLDGEEPGDSDHHEVVLAANLSGDDDAAAADDGGDDDVYSGESQAIALPANVPPLMAENCSDVNLGCTINKYYVQEAKHTEAENPRFNNLKHRCVSVLEAECYCPNKGTSMYVGKRMTTESGIPCQRWDQQSPHTHDKKDPAMFPDDTLTASENFCRNPDGPPWCYMTNRAVKWQNCGIPVCKD
ncbi:plasminogen-like [Gigantopelta aegis]|uniref:plasminogen-like n=1 Tax=Gigantopelta aegis TaxID=1735272 RepID=UPI001B887FEB|nr:plasminogen-like [Gigantopelta aegis]